MVIGIGAGYIFQNTGKYISRIEQDELWLGTHRKEREMGAKYVEHNCPNMSQDEFWETIEYNPIQRYFCSLKEKKGCQKPCDARKCNSFKFNSHLYDNDCREYEFQNIVNNIESTIKKIGFDSGTIKAIRSNYAIAIDKMFDLIVDLMSDLQKIEQDSFWRRVATGIERNPFDCDFCNKSDVCRHYPISFSFFNCDFFSFDAKEYMKER